MRIFLFVILIFCLQTTGTFAQLSNDKEIRSGQIKSTTDISLEKASTHYVFTSTYEANLLSFYVDSLTPDTTVKPIYLKVKMNNDDEFKGELIFLDSTRLNLKTLYSTLNLIRSDIKLIQIINSLEKQELITSQNSNYFLGPSAIPQEKGALIYKNVMLEANVFEAGITKNVSMDVGFLFTSFFSDPTYTVSVKGGFQISKNIHAGAGIRYVAEYSKSSIGLGYALLTIGKLETNLTLGAGYGVADGNPLDKMYFIGSGICKIGDKAALLSENYYSQLSSNDFFYTGTHGLRISGKRDNSMDLGFYFTNQLLVTSFSVLPVIGYTKKF